jgi:hypothetical protein
MTEPQQVLIAGDWHTNTLWAKAVIEKLPEAIPEGPRILLHVGDFGLWPGPEGKRYLYEVTAALAAVDAELWFVDGNHEDHARLTALLAARHGNRSQPIPITDRITWLPRGYRWTWHDREWLALGGATSVDRAVRIPGRSWWANESIHHADFKAAVAGGHADVMVTHDCPQGVPLSLSGNVPGWWELGPAEEHRRILRQIVDQVKPFWLVHGHYHLFHNTVVDLGWGCLRVVGLDCDGAWAGHTVLCDVRDMTFKDVFRE